jgi:hypothetical protein
MKRLTLAAVALAAFAVPASADLNCEKDFKAFWERLAKEAPAKALTGAQYAQVSRTALRGYDACTSGDERFSAKNFFEKIDLNAPAKADELFRELDKNKPAKK